MRLVGGGACATGVGSGGTRAAGAGGGDTISLVDINLAGAGGGAGLETARRCRPGQEVAMQLQRERWHGQEVATH